MTTAQITPGDYGAKSIVYYWDPLGLAYIVGTQPAGGGGGGAVTVADGADVTAGAKADTAWDGAAASPTAQGILKYLGAKLEAVRALLAGTLTIGGSVTANAGTNLNTSLLALESGHLATIDTHLDVNLSTRLKPADTLTGVTTVGAVTSITNALPAGTNVIGHVIVDTAPTTPVTGVFWQTTQPVSAASLPLPSNAAQETGGNLAAIVAAEATGNTSLATLVTLAMTQQADLLSAIYRELKINNALLQDGLNVQDDLELFRSDPSYLN